MSKILIITRKENLNLSMKEKLQKELDCEFMSVNAHELLDAFRAKKAELAVIYLTGLSSDEELEVSKFLANSVEIPVILAGNREVLSRYYEKTKANILRYIATPILLSDYISEIKKILAKIEPSENKTEVQKNQAESEVTSEEEIKVAAPKTILVIDDDIVMLRTINNWLNEFFQVALAPGCVDAIKYFNNHTPDLILLDYDMPVYNGIETLRLIRAMDKLKDTPVFFLTGVDDDQAVKQALSLKPQGYILKSNGADYLLSKIQQYL